MNTQLFLPTTHTQCVASQLTHVSILVFAKAVEIEWFLVDKELFVCDTYVSNTQRLSIQILYITSTDIYLKFQVKNDTFFALNVTKLLLETHRGKLGWNSCSTATKDVVLSK